MKSRLTLIFAALVVLLGAMVWVVQNQKAIKTVPEMAVAPSVANQVTPAVVQAAVPATGPSAVAGFVMPVVPPMVHVDPSGEVKYIARVGDTVSQLAIALLGSDSKEHRIAVIAANPSLQSNPDLVMEGQIYSIVPPRVLTADEAVANQQPGGAMTAVVPTPAPVENTQSVKPASDETIPADVSGAKLKYIAQPGDSVAILAGNLLGGDTKANRETIIAGNASLQQNPDHLVAGKSYTIMAPNGLAADPNAPQAKAPTTEPDADEAARLSMGRVLRYTAQPGDSVSKLAVVLLGSDTPANRDLITKSNPSLKKDPDHLVAGQTYWIAAPVADAAP